MKWLSLLAVLPFTSAALAQEPPEITHAPKLIQARVEMTYWQNWCLGTGAILTGVSAIGALIYSDSCVTTVIIVSSDKRSIEVVGVDAVTYNLGAQGYASYGEWHLHDNGTQAFDGFFTNGEIRLENLSVSSNYTTGRVSLENGT
ncbi:hypothetical protein N7453_002939 [Penicillium expansum]|nr:hypothetical protein N7453_002939 [Penicillium expansum]